MGCAYLPELRGSEFALSIREQVLRDRIPLTGSVEITHRCNNECVHCYCNLAPDDGYAKSGELTAAEWATVFEELVAEGCLYLLITGGEPTLRRDFKDIWIAAKKAGLLVTLFTNGTLITEELADFLAEWPPRHVEVTLYGYSKKTYEEVTLLPGTWEKCYRGVYHLLERGLPLTLKTFVCSINLHEFHDMKKFAADCGVDFRWDAQMHARLDGNRSPFNFALTSEQIVALEMEEEDRWNRFLEYADLYWGKPEDNKLFNCGAGISMFHIDPYGKLGICTNVRNVTHDLRRLGGFRAAWDGKLAHYRMTREAPGDQPCRTCDSYGICGSCPGRSLFEHGNDHERVESRCDLTQLRTKHVKEHWERQEREEEDLLAEMLGSGANSGGAAARGAFGHGLSPLPAAVTGEAPAASGCGAAKNLEEMLARLTAPDA